MQSFFHPKTLKQWLALILAEAIIVTFSLWILKELLEAVWPVFKPGLYNHPLEIACGGLVLTTATSLYVMGLWRNIALMERERAMKLAGVESALDASKKSFLDLQAKYDDLVSKAKDAPDPNQMIIFTCLFSLRQATPSEISRETKMDSHFISSQLVFLQHKYQLVRSVSVKGNGESVFAPTPTKGVNFAVQHGIEAMEQSYEAYKETAAEAEVARYKKLYEEAQSKMASLEREINEMR